jgi:ribosomal-protein-alanine N-acetyltransferase
MVMIPTMTTARLVLRPFTEEDAEPLHRILGQEGVLRYFPNPEPPPRERVVRFVLAQLRHWEEHGFGWWAVEPRSGEGLIGWNGLQYLPKTHEVEIGFLLSRAYWGQGLAVEGGEVGLRYGFERLGLETIVALVHPENKASQRVIEKLGLSFVEQAEYFGMDVYRYVRDALSYRGAASPASGAGSC